MSKSVTSEQVNALGQPIGAELDNWQPCPQPATTPIYGQFCNIEPLKMEHADALFGAFAEDVAGGNWTYLPVGPFEHFEDFQHWLKQCCQSKDPLFFAVIDKRTQQAVGMASYLRIQPEVGVIEVGHIHFSPLMQKTPLATEAMYLMMKRVFSELGYRRYEWKCDNCNAPSKAAAQRLGFTFEGIFRQAIVYKGRNRDTAWFSILDNEWPQIQQMYLRWLSADNFTADGQQILSLQKCSNIPTTS